MDDLAAVIREVGGSASLFGHSSGAVLALEAAQRGLAIDKLAVYEPPYIVDGTRPRPAVDFADRLQSLLPQGRRDEAVTLFQTDAVGLPAEMIEAMRDSEVWSWLTRFADTLPYEVALFDPRYPVPMDRLANIGVPTLTIDGGASWDWIRAATRAVADAIPGARYVTLDGQDHGVLHHPEALRPLLLDFLA